MSEVAVLAALRVMGFDKDTVTGHGFRPTARTLLDEVLGFRPDIIEHQLPQGSQRPGLQPHGPFASPPPDDAALGGLP